MGRKLRDMKHQFLKPGWSIGDESHTPFKLQGTTWRVRGLSKEVHNGDK